MNALLSFYRALHKALHDGIKRNRKKYEVLHSGRSSRDGGEGRHDAAVSTYLPTYLVSYCQKPVMSKSIAITVCP